MADLLDSAFITAMVMGNHDRTPLDPDNTDDRDRAATLRNRVVFGGHGGYLDFERLMPTVLFGEKRTAPVTEILKGVVKDATITSQAQIRPPENAESRPRSRFTKGEKQ